MLCYFLVFFLKLHPFLLSALLSLLLSPSPWHACFHCHQLQMDTRQDTNPAPTTWAGRKCRPCSPLPVRDPARAEPAPARAAPSHYGVLIYSWWFTAASNSDLQCRHQPPSLQCLSKRVQVRTWHLYACTGLGVHPASFPWPQPRKEESVSRVELSSWESAGSRLPREGRCSRHYSFSQPGRAARMILPHPRGMSQERCTSKEFYGQRDRHQCAGPQSIPGFYSPGSGKTLQRLGSEKMWKLEVSEVNAVLLLMDQQGICSEVFLPLLCLWWNHSWGSNTLTES